MKTSNEAFTDSPNKREDLKAEIRYGSTVSIDPGLIEKIKVRRLFSSAQIFFFTLTFMSSWEAISLNISAMFWNGGPQVLAFGGLLVVFGAISQTASLAELASILPIAGAQYHWTNSLAPPRYRRIITWFQGWVTWFGWISLLCGVANVTAVMIQNLAVLNYPSYVPERWHVTLIIYAMCIIQGLMNVYIFWTLPWIELLAGMLHIIMFIILLIVLLLRKDKHTADFVFFQRASNSGWTNNYVSWNLGLLTPTWGFVGFDGAVHMGEEVRKARQAVPRAMFWTVVMNGTLAWVMAIVVLFCMGSLDDALNSPFPIIEIILRATGSAPATTAIVTGILITSLAVNLGSIASVSRLTWAWSRDGALPAWFSVLSQKHRIPTRALWLPIFITMILALLNIASTSAFGAILALAELGLYASYFIAIACMLHARLTTPPRDPSTTNSTDSSLPYFDAHNPPWSLGRLGVPINIFALCFTAYITVWLPFPSTLPVTALNMNYAGPIFGFVVLMVLASWFLWARRHWKGVRRDIVRLVWEDSGRGTKDL